MVLFKRSVFVRFLSWVLLPAMALSSGCVPNSRLVYLQDPAQVASGSPVSYTSDRRPYHLQAGDVLSVTVKGIDQELQNTFNTSSGGFGGAVLAEPAAQYANGYSIDDNGDIILVSVGKVQVRGLTVSEANTLCQKRISAFLKEATVSVKLVSFKVTILGEVRRPGYYYVTNLRCNILEAIGLGGDLTNVANRERVKVIRQTDAGSEVAIVDITNANVVHSPYYALQPNDVVYIEPFSGQTPRKNFTPVNLGLGIVSGIATIVLLILTLQQNAKK